MEGIPAMAAKTEGGARPKRRSRSKATSAGTAERPAPRARLPREPDPLKQAVVVIHGMGEQAPMATLRSFVRAIWETDLSLTRKAPDKDKVRRMDGGETVNRAWIVPDTRTGSLELSRIATPAGDFGARTDFFEFYWADIMAGTTFEHVKAWVSGLLLRWPHQVPNGMRRAWVILWLLVILTAGTAAMGIFGLTSGEDQAPPDAAWIALSRLIGFGIVAAVAIVAMVGLQIRLARAPRRPAVSWAFTVVVPLAFAAVAWLFVPWPSVFTFPILSLAASALFGYAIQAFLVPYFGDVARYVRPAPDTIAKRAEVRERGLALLRRLNGKPVSMAGTERYDFGEEEPYHRIIVVAHSLGSIIAYDILSHFWTEVGPTISNPAGPAGLMALQAVDQYLHDCALPEDNADRKTFEIGEFRRLQRMAADALGAEKGGWKITDFVTVGSPLAHAEFLIAIDRDRLDRLIGERQVPVSPPMREHPGDDFLYLSRLAGRPSETVARHDSIFAATRWTNIYDPHNLATGDIISGPVSPVFGKGVEDHCVRIRRPFLASQRSRIFTHTHYWSLESAGRACSPLPPVDGREVDEHEVGDHVRLLREAVALDDIAMTRQDSEETIV